MTVAELIEVLSKANPWLKVTVWDGYDDEMSDEIHVSLSSYYPDHTWQSEEKTVMIASFVLNDEEFELSAPNRTETQP